MKFVHVALIGMLAPFSTACFAYHTLEAPSPGLKPGAELRAALSDPGRFELTGIAVDNVSLVEGEFVEWNADSLVLSVTWLRAMGGAEYLGRGETAVVPASRLERLERKKVSVPRTLGLIGVAILGSVVVNAGLRGGASGNPGGPRPVPQQ